MDLGNRKDFEEAIAEFKRAVDKLNGILNMSISGELGNVLHEWHYLKGSLDCLEEAAKEKGIDLEDVS